MKSSVSSCPVPFEQQPLNEYQELKESWYFRWGTFAFPQYLRKLLWIWFWSWIIAGPIAAASFPIAKYPAQFALMGMAGATLFLSLVLLRLYLGWTYIRSRLFDATVFYEESGWYDGQLWEKPPEMLAQDRLVVTYQIQPILKRLTQTFGVLAIGLLAGSLAWKLL
ncbi:CGLD27 family protein [Stenomitos frigidus]|uniref:DUF1230 domain-containing protein n=1 Tax=Stenomitos frigidus ULC18 TaxID=2107698 RepID=A0A2T1DW62_9CYAN|nr:CGLD27 family protein [Stenomitos frigidus]PSB24743.1 DUF1230 domain-containing protein [Stenomitos frigidus ULC18]